MLIYCLIEIESLIIAQNLGNNTTAEPAGLAEELLVVVRPVIIKNNTTILAIRQNIVRTTFVLGSVK